MAALSGGCGKWIERVVEVIELKGAQFLNSVVLHAVFFYVRYAVSCRRSCR